MASLPEQPERLDLRSHDIAGDKLAQLLELFPEARTEDGQIDIEQLRRALGEAVDPGKERYGLTWPGKADCFKTIQTPSLGTLLPAPDESVNWDSTENLIIEGDNLEVLKLLQKSYLGKVKMIYIDPPYNTGNDFIYPDDYAESLKTYLEYTGQVDEEGRKFSTNTDTDGRFHSKWLNMMYPRLYLARNLLRDDGVIFISIDDGELRRLLFVLDEIFGEENLMAVVVNKNKAGAGAKPRGFIAVHDYIVCYQRDRTETTAVTLPMSTDQAALYSKRDDKFETRGPYGTWALATTSMAERPNLRFPIVHEGEEIWPEKQWLWSQDRVRAAQDRNELVFNRKSDGKWSVRFKRYLKDESGTLNLATPTTVWDGPFTHEGTRDMDGLFTQRVFPFPKPRSLIAKLLALRFGQDHKTHAATDDIVLDFFAGSGTTAHAVLDLNAQDGGNRKFILVQLPEPTEREDYPTIADITKERVRRVIGKLNQEKGEAERQDRGFRVFKLAESSFNIWEAQGSRQLGAFLEQLQLHVDNVRDDRSAEDVLFELLLKSGYPLSATIEPLDITGKRVFSVAGDALLVCLDRGLSLELMRTVAERKPERFVVLDEGFAGNDQLKANAVQIFKAVDVTFRTV